MLGVVAELPITGIYLLMLCALWPILALLSKRLHDMNLPGSHAAWIMGLNLASEIVTYGSAPYWLVTVAGIGVGAWLMFTPGTDGENDYGRLIESAPSSMR